MEVTCGGSPWVSVFGEELHVRICSRRSIAELSLFMTVLALGSAQQNSQGSDDTRAQISSPPVSCRKKLNMKSGSWTFLRELKSDWRNKALNPGWHLQGESGSYSNVRTLSGSLPEKLEPEGTLPKSVKLDVFVYQVKSQWKVFLKRKACKIWGGQKVTWQSSWQLTRLSIKCQTLTRGDLSKSTL